MDPDDPAYRGQAGYTPFLLAIYDPFVLGFMAHVVWRCPTAPVVDRYRQHLGRRHLDVGPGTGYFLHKAGLPPGAEVSLLDPNPTVLARASRRLAPLTVAAVEADVLKPLPVRPFRLGGAQLRPPLSPRSPGSQGARHQKRRRRARAERCVVWGHRAGRIRTPHTARSGSPRAFNWQGAVDNLADTEEGLREDPGGVVSNRRDRRGRLHRSVHGHRPAMTLEALRIGSIPDPLESQIQLERALRVRRGHGLVLLRTPMRPWKGGVQLNGSPPTPPDQFFHDLFSSLYGSLEPRGYRYD